MILSVSALFFMCSFYIYEIYHYIYYYSYNNTFCFCFVLFMHFFLILAYFSLVPDSSLFHISDFYLQLFLSVPVSSFRSCFSLQSFFFISNLILFLFPIWSYFSIFQSDSIFLYFQSDSIFLYFQSDPIFLQGVPRNMTVCKTT